MKVTVLTPEMVTADIRYAPGLPPFDTELVAQQQADAHVLAACDGFQCARASLWWTQVPTMHGERLGVIGHFAASDAGSAQHLLEAARARLHSEGCTLMVGPMDGNTWRRYRFVTDAGSEPPCFLEPENPPDYPRYFTAAGFVPLAEYSSALVTDLTAQDARVPRAIGRLQQQGITWRALDLDHFERELRAIYALSVQSFSQNFLYTPITEAQFLAQYRAIASYVKPELTLMAEYEGELLGYLFGIPDLNQAKRGEPVDTFIVKTVAVLPGRRSAGLGSVLVAESQRIAREHGYGRAIHALMHESNTSKNISAHYAQTMRRYTLFQKRIGPAA